MATIPSFLTRSKPTDDLPALNRELMERTMEYVRAHPEQHDQSYWIQLKKCGTTRCFAGWAVELGTEGGTVPVLGSGRSYDDPDGTLVCYVARADSADEVSVPTLASELLGLTTLEHVELFHCTDEELEGVYARVMAGEFR